MKTRVLTAAVALPVLVASIVLPSYFPQAVWLFIIIAALALSAGLFEFYSLTKKLELKADAAVGYIGAAIIFLAFLIDAPAKAPDLLLLALAPASAAALVVLTNGEAGRALRMAVVCTWLQFQGEGLLKECGGGGEGTGGHPG